ncbi:MAG: TetR family transcriptional regulator [Streptosporangiaceae bacterium]
MAAEPGLRERKKHKTRQLIADTARELFARRGFENVSVAEIARAAEVSETTVFNYFPTKEDLIFQGLDAFEDQLLQAVRDRPPGEEVLQAFGRFILAPRGLLAAADPASAGALVSASRLIASSPALAAREQQILTGWARSLAALLAEETGASPGDLTAAVVANTLIGVHRAVLDYVRQQINADPASARRLARTLPADGHKALELLAGGLAGYGVRPPQAADQDHQHQPATQTPDNGLPKTIRPGPARGGGWGLGLDTLLP